MIKSMRIWLMIAVLCAAFVPRSAGRAQDAATPITIGVPQGLTFQFKENVLPSLQQAFPDLRLNIVETGIVEPLDPQTPEKIDKYYKALDANASAADVLWVTPDDVGAESTSAGYFLDLKPLISADSTFDPADYAPPVWSAYQWNQGVWALPSLYDLSFLVYDPAAFDQAKWSYPAANWTLDDLATAARRLAVYASDQKTVKVPGLLVYDRDLPALLSSLAGEPFTDPAAAISAPTLASDKLAAVVQVWAKLEQDGVVTNHPDESAIFKIPMQIGDAFTARDPTASGPVSGGDKRALRGALLPGDSAELTAYGFAVSRGSAQPDAAYKVAKALTALPELGTIVGGAQLARKSTAASAGSAAAFTLSTENNAFVISAADKAVPTPRYGNYLRGAIDAVKGGQDALIALRNAETKAAQVLSDAQAKRATLILAVAEPNADATPSNKQTLKFGIFTGNTSLPRADWQKVVNEFVAADPQVGKITLDFLPPVTSDYFKKLQAFPDNEDCFYLGYANANVFKDRLLSLDPLLDVDPTFDRADVVGGALRDVQRANHVYGFPLTLKPLTLRYNIQQFKQAGLATPVNGWTIDQFIDALKALKTAQPDKNPFHPYLNASGDYLFMLIAAYGQLPIDWRTDPPTINYTAPATVDAIRQVLDLAKNGYIDYSPTAAFVFNITSPYTSGMFVDDFSAFGGGDTSGYAQVMFPVGSKYAPISYMLNAAYISAKTALPDACYRWIKALSDHTDLIGGIPARRSVINAPRTEATDGKEAVTTYNAFADQLNAPNTIVMHTESIGIANKWLNRAFDNYVLHDADLESELRDAEQYTKAYFMCIAGPDAETDPNNPAAIFVDDKCANKIDPTFIKSLFSPQN